jgi:hypothetical protein
MGLAEYVGGEEAMAQGGMHVIFRAALLLRH